MNMRSPHRSVMTHARRAFTLLELVIVLGIILLLMGLVLGVGSIVLRQSEDRQIRSTMAIVDAALVEFEQQAGREMVYEGSDEEYCGFSNCRYVDAYYDVPVEPYADNRFNGDIEDGAFGWERNNNCNPWNSSSDPRRKRMAATLSVLAQSPACGEIIAKADPSLVHAADCVIGSSGGEPLTTTFNMKEFIDPWDREVFIIFPGRRWYDCDQGTLRARHRRHHPDSGRDRIRHLSQPPPLAGLLGPRRAIRRSVERHRRRQRRHSRPPGQRLLLSAGETMMTRLRDTSSSRAFTLLELLVVIGIISVLSVATVISVQKVSRDVKSTGVNRVLGALTSARSEAIRSNTPTLVTFRVVKDYEDPSKPEQVGVVVAQFTGDIRSAGSYGSTSNAYFSYRPVPTIAPRLLPEGIKVAAPYTEFQSHQRGHLRQRGHPLELHGVGADGTHADHLRRGQHADHDLRHPQRTVGGGFAVLFSGDGTMIMRDPNTIVSAEKSAYRFVDFDADREFDVSKDTGGYGGNSVYFEQRQTDRDFLVNSAQFLVVYDEERAKEDVDFTNWDAEGGVVDFIRGRNAELGPWVTENADRIHFNRYTGLAEVGGR